MDESIILKSGIHESYVKHFILDEDSLRRIQGILVNASKDLQEKVITVFQVIREDNRFYETSNIEDILSDPNIRGKRIMELSIELRSVEKGRPPWGDWIARVRFVIKEQLNEVDPGSHFVTFTVSAENRNWALLLADALEPQIMRVFKAKATPRWLLLTFLIPVVFLYVKLRIHNTGANDEPIGVIIVFTVLFILWLVSKGFGGRYFSYWFGPESVCLWGDEGQEYLVREQTRKNIMWGIIIAFIISFLSSGLWLLK